MKRIPAMRSIMTPFPHSVEINAPVREAKRMMERHDIRHLPVVDGGKLVGVVSDRDVKLALDPALSLIPAGELRVRNVCAKKAYTVELTEMLDRVLIHMAEHHIEATLIVKEGRLAGIFTMTDACERFAGLLRTLFPKGGDDAA